MGQIGQHERVTQNRVVQLFKEKLGYEYLGSRQDRNNKNIETERLTKWLTKQLELKKHAEPGVKEKLISHTIRKLEQAAALGQGKKLYDANQEIYNLLRYGAKIKTGAGELTETVWLIDWKKPEANVFAIAEEVSVQGKNIKRPDLVLYVNGIALGIIELKRASVSVSAGIRQNLDNQREDFIREFFTTIQLVMAGNDSEGLRYGTIETAEKYYLQWKEEGQDSSEKKLDYHLSCLCRKSRFLQIIHDFIVFDAGTKKTCRHNQFFGVVAAQEYIRNRQGGIIWHTQGSGKSLTMVWLAKWIRENINNSRVLIVTDRTELDEQIEKVFCGVSEEIYRSKSGANLIRTLNHPNPPLICSLVHKFGRQSEKKENTQETEAFIEEMKKSLPKDFTAKGDLFVFVDECHRTQSGKLHQAMKQILPNALFIGFTGTPIMKKDKKESRAIFGPYIHTYKFDEAVADGVVLDLLYEARDIDQHIDAQNKIDDWFETKTRGLSQQGKNKLKQKWGTLQKIFSSKERLKRIVTDIVMDMAKKPRLLDGCGNAMLVCSSVYEACRVYDIFSHTELKGKVAMVTSFQPTADSIKGEETGEGTTEKQVKYNTYRKMLADYFEQSEDQAAGRVDEFEKEVKKRFIKEPGRMCLLIVVDKLLTGFDAPPATYLYIDKTMRDHNLFQAICRVNRLDGEDKKYGYIIDYKDLFHSLNKTIKDYTQEALGGFDKEDTSGLLKNCPEQAKTDLDDTLEAVRALCEPVKAPRKTEDYMNYFCGISGENQHELPEKEKLRLTLYKQVNKLLRAFTNIASTMADAGYTAAQERDIRADVEHYKQMCDEIKLISGDRDTIKRFEPAMRHLLDMYIHADSSKVLMDFEEQSLIELIVNKGADVVNDFPHNIREKPEVMAATIDNNVRKAIIDKNLENPKYYEKMSELLDKLIESRKKQAIEYQQYLQEICKLAKQVVNPGETSTYPASVDTLAKRAFYDNFGKDQQLVAIIDTTIRHTKKADWSGDHFKERELKNALSKKLNSYDIDLDKVMELAKEQREYQ